MMPFSFDIGFGFSLQDTVFHILLDWGSDYKRKRYEAYWIGALSCKQEANPIRNKNSRPVAAIGAGRARLPPPNNFQKLPFFIHHV